jgi:UDP-N-acetylmuramate dehydrogenase
MIPFQDAESLIQRLPVVQGRYNTNVILAKYTWFRVGGMAEVVFKPDSIEDLGYFLAGKPEDVPLTIMGVGSNLLIRDYGIPGVTIRLGGRFGNVEILENGLLRAGAGCLDSTVAEIAKNAGLSGFEFLIGVPGTIGGGLRMNAGAYGQEIKDIFVEARAIDPSGKIHKLQNKDMDFTYRHSGIPEGWFFVEGLFQGKRGDSLDIEKRMEDIKLKRQLTQPIKTRTGGSTFVNPQGLRAWELVDAAGCRGLKQGGAMISDLHCNFMINLGEATANDLESLGEKVREKVLKQSGILLEWEIKRLGLHKPLSQ